MSRRNSNTSRGGQPPRLFIADPLERKRRGLPLVSGSEWRMYLRPDQIDAYVDQQIERQKFFGSMADQKRIRVDRAFDKYFSGPDFEPKRNRVFHEPAEWDFDNPEGAADV